MKILSLDTTTREGSTALVDDDRIVEVRRGDAARSHAERLPSELIALLDAHRLTFHDVDLFAIASGPGSFTGLRIGIATIQGLAFTCGRRVVAVSALEALAHQAAEALPADRVVAAWIDAHRREVFSGVYRTAAAGAPFDAGRLSAIDGASVGAPASMLEALQALAAAEAIVFNGDGALLYAEEIRRAIPSAEILPAAPIAGVVGRIAADRARRGETLDPAGIQPLYVRRPDAEVARDARL